MIRVIRGLPKGARTANPEYAELGRRKALLGGLGLAGWTRAPEKEHCLLHASPSSVPNPLARVSLKKCPRGVKLQESLFYLQRRVVPTPRVNSQPLAGLWVEVVTTLLWLFYNEFFFGSSLQGRNEP